MASVSDSVPIAEVLDWLYQRRKALSCIYGVLLLCMLTVGLLPPAAIVSKLHWQQSRYFGFSDPKFFDLLVFSPVTQLLFLWGGGRILHERRSWLRVVLPTLVTVLVLSFGAVRCIRNLSTWDYESVLEEWMINVFLVATLVSVLPAAIIKSRRSDHYRTLVFLNTLMLMVIVIFCSLTLALIITEGQAWGWSNSAADSFAADAFIPAYLLTFVLGTSLVLLWHRRQVSAKERKKKSIGGEELDNTATFKAGPYLSSAASVSSLLLIVLYFGISQGISYSSHLYEIGEIRRAFLREAFVTYVRPTLNTADLQTILNAGKEADIDSLKKNVWGTIRNISVSPPRGIIEEKFAGNIMFDTRRLCTRAVIREYQMPQPWGSMACFQLKDLIAAGSGMPPTSEPTQELADLALSHAVKLEKGEPFEALYLRIENELLQKEVAFPSSGFSFPVEQAVWLSNLVAFLMLVMLHDRLSHVLDDAKPGDGEPWLILDAKDPIAKGVAILWCIGMGTGPWLLCMTTARMTFLELAVYESRPSFLLQMLMFVAFFFVTGPLSISVVAYVLRLKKLRRMTMLLLT